MAASEPHIAASIMEDLNINTQGDVFQNHRNLVDWITKENDGYLHPDVRIAHSPEKGFYMTVAQDKTIQALTRVTSSPMTATLSVLNAFDITPFRSHGAKFPPTFLKKNVTKPELIQIFFLMEQYVLGNKSWWSPYIKTLPSIKDINDLQFESRQNQIWLEGTNLKSAFVSQNTKWQEMYTKGLRELKIFNWQPALDGRFSWELFRWAAAMFGSRSFTSDVLTDTEPADQARMEGRHGVKKSEDAFLKPLFVERFAVLLPLLDILNHRPIAQVEWQARCSFVGMQVLTSFSSGEELCNNYGPRDNETLLLSYGFIIEDNPFDHVAIALKPPPPGSPLATARKHWKQDIRSTLDYRSYIFSISHPRALPDAASSLESSIFSYDLLDTLSILKGNDRELQTMYILTQTLMSSSLAKPHKFDDFRNLLAVLSQLHLDCKARAERLRSTYPQGNPQNTKQRHAKVYRDHQLTIVETATALCELVLVRACSDRGQDKILAAMEEHTSLPAFNDLRKLLSQHTLITRQSELLTVRKVMEFLSEHHLAMIKIAMAAIEAHLPSNQKEPVQDARPQSPTSPSKRNRSPNQPQPEPKAPRQAPTPSKSTPPPPTEPTPPPPSPSSPTSSTTPTSDLPIDPLSSSKTLFSLILATSLHLYQTGISLPLRLCSWLEQLTAWYPPNDENWSYVPTQGPWERGEEPPRGLVELLCARQGVVDETKHFQVMRDIDLLGTAQETARELSRERGIAKGHPAPEMAMTPQRAVHYLTPEKICWAWNVLEEEGVVVSRDIVDIAMRGERAQKGEGADDAVLGDQGGDEIGVGSEAGAGAGGFEGPRVEFLLYSKV